MPANFVIKTNSNILECTRVINHFAIDFGLSKYDTALLILAISEASTNAIRYANEAKLLVSYTTNKLGIQINIDDNGKGITNLKEAINDGYSSISSSLGLGLGVINRSVDEFLITKSDETGTSIILRKYLRRPLYNCSEISIKKQDKIFNSDSTFIKHYDGDKSLFVVLDLGKIGEKANKYIMIIKNYILNNYRLSLDDILKNINLLLRSEDNKINIEITILRLCYDFIEYICLGDTFIRSYPYMNFINYKDSLESNLRNDIKVHKIYYKKEFCICLCSDGIDKELILDSLYSNYSAVQLSTNIFNKFNNDDDSSLIVIKKDKENGR